MDQNFLQIKDSIANWVYGIKNKLHYVETDIVLDSSNSLRVIFESKEYLAELLVEQGSFTPYRFVKLEILPLTSSYPEPVYIWYDSQNDDISSIISNLQIGLNYFKQ